MQHSQDSAGPGYYSVLPGPSFFVSEDFSGSGKTFLYRGTGGPDWGIVCTGPGKREREREREKGGEREVHTCSVGLDHIFF